MALIPQSQFNKPWFLTLFLIIAIIQLFLASSAIYGYSSILVIFKKMKFYQYLCETKNLTGSPNKTVVVSETLTCNDQDKALNLLFVLGWLFHNLVKLVTGPLVDRVGPQVSQYISCVFLLLFGFTLAYAKEGLEYLVFIAFFELAIGSSITLLTCFQVVNILFKENKAIFICLMSGAIDASTAVFILFLAIFESDLPLSTISMSYGCLMVVFMVMVTTIFFPSKYELSVVIDEDVKDMLNPNTKNKDFVKFSKELTASYQGGVTSSYSAYKHSIEKTLLEMSADERRTELSLSLSRSMGFSWSQSELCSSMDSVDKRGRYGVIQENTYGYGVDQYGLQKLANASNEESPLISSVEKNFMCDPDKTFLQCFFSKFNFLCILTVAIMMLKLVYFVGNIDKYLRNIVDEEEAVVYVKYFGTIQFVGILVGPIAGLLFMHNKLSCKKTETIARTVEQQKFDDIRSLIMPILVSIIVMQLLNGLQLFEQLYLSFPIFLVYLLGNGLMWCTVTYFYALLFPPQYYCSLYGYNGVMCGLFCLMQYPMLYIEQSYFKNQQFYTNVVFLGLLLLPLSLPAYLKYYCWRYEKQDESLVLENSNEKI
ncbi:large neutral amino acids transporter small subunit 4-like [Hydractinia symbiolongicarpus]|uniref:large neutral amino acids transporter small subunit 4-like n=1 Tax=Hydractinia symbiolongicarpus TaxID=13093 RepID=UPI00254CD1A8|nr:large neutral amino acids transporter small subunit 4-like [Hydractinia symbiolongicarpus]XP_057315822.1 large neutral amino acids transporter small subunit 4-like [Hydractinia symbiolongicarpus]